MRQYIATRLLLTIPVIVGVSLLVFFILRVLPGDVIALKYGIDANPELVAAERERLGLNRPIYEQYLSWVGGALRGDLGTSLTAGRNVRQEITSRVPVSLELAVLASLVSISIAIPGGVIAAWNQDGPLDYAARLISITALAVPGFWLATLMLTFSAIWFQWIPPLVVVPPWENPVQNLQTFLLPAIAIGASFSAITMRMVRSMMLEVLRQDYVRTARERIERDHCYLKACTQKRAHSRYHNIRWSIRISSRWYCYYGANIHTSWPWTINTRRHYSARLSANPGECAVYCSCGRIYKPVRGPTLRFS